jgi:TonB family protein
MKRQRTFQIFWMVAAVVRAAPALAQSGVALPVGENLRDRPEQPSDVVLDISSAGLYSLGGRPVPASQLPGIVGALLSRTRERIVYLRADASLPFSAIDSASVLAVRGGACVASFVGRQERGMVSHVSGDAGEDAGNVRRAIDVQLPLPRTTSTMLTRQQSEAIVLEVLPGPAYRINTQPVPAERLASRLREIFDPRPIKILYVRADPTMSYKDVFHTMDVARYASIIDIVAAPPDLAIRSRLPDIDLSLHVTPRDDSTAAHVDGNVGRCRRGDVYFGQYRTDDDRVYFEFQVQIPVKRLADSVVPRYPEMLRSAHTSGQVLAQFVVDTNGLAQPETFKIIRSTHDLFSSSVKAALPSMRFVPATLGGKHVRQLVQMPFDFTVSP